MGAHHQHHYTVRHILPGTHVLTGQYDLGIALHTYKGKWSNQTNVNIQSLQLHLSALESTCRTVPYKVVNAVIVIASSGTRVVSRDHCVRVSTRLCRWCAPVGSACESCCHGAGVNFAR